MCVCRVELYFKYGSEFFKCLMLYVNIHDNRSHKEKRSSYAPEKGLRYDGIYRIEKCWRKVGIQVLLLFFVIENDACFFDTLLYVFHIS